MRRVNTFKKWTYHTCENLDCADVRRCWCTRNCWCTQLIQIKEINKSRQIHITYGRRDMATPYLRGIGRYPNLPVSMLFNDNDHFYFYFYQLFQSLWPGVSATIRYDVCFECLNMFHFHAISVILTMLDSILNIVLNCVSYYCYFITTGTWLIAQIKCRRNLPSALGGE